LGDELVPDSQLQAAFADSPFALTATPSIGVCWAGREEILNKINRVVRTLSNRPDSALDLIWANFGAGKSHALFHLAHLLQSGSQKVTCAYVEIPESARHFLDLYRRIILAIPWQELSSIIGSAPMGNVSEDLRRAMRVIAHGNTSERTIATEWLSAGRPLLRELRSYTGISARIEDDTAATDTLSDIVKVLGHNHVRLVLLLDEFQRLGSLQERYRSGLLSSLRSIFSRNPTHFSVIAAATTRIERTALDLLPQELRTLMGMRPSISLPEMTENEAVEFVLERFKCFRPPGYAGDPAAPLGEEAVRAAVSFIAQEGSGRLIPRIVLQALSWVLDETDESQRPVSTETVRELLGQLSWDMVEGEHAN
jgi:hypothetical protein